VAANVDCSRDMDEQAESSELDKFLRREGLPLKLLKLKRRRERSNVWSAVLAGPMGDANLEILVYALGDHPERVSDFEDDKAALWAMGSLRRAIEGDVVFEGRSERLGVIVVAEGEEARIARAVRGVLLAGSEEETSLWYHPQLDRILNGASIHEFGTRWAKSSLMATEHAIALHAATEQLRAVISGVVPDDAVPQTLAIFEPERVAATVGGHERNLTPAELLALPTMALAPSRYQRLAQYVGVIAEPRTVDDPATAAATRGDLSDFATLLLRIVAGAHGGAAATFRSGIGSCLRPEFVTPTGRLTDLYFLRLSDELDADVLSRLQTEDVVNALDVVKLVAEHPGEQFAQALLSASEAYLGGALSSGLTELVRDTALDPTGDPGNRRLTVLAVELRRVR